MRVSPFVVAGVMAAGATASAAGQATTWPVHSMERPKPPIVNPAPVPSDALVLSSLDAWQDAEGRDASWTEGEGWFEVRPGAGSIQTREAFRDVQLHIEWMAPRAGEGGQNWGNSGVYLMSRYEVQVLNSFGNETYADGQAASLYGQFPPQVNASLPPGTWQTYDIVFHAPRFRADGTVADSAVVTVFHNGVLVQDHVRLRGATAHAREARYEAHEDRLPIVLQDHGERVRFRNIWVRELN